MLCRDRPYPPSWVNRRNKYRSGNVSRAHASRRFHGEQSLAELAQDASCGQVTLRDLARRFISGIYKQLRKIGDLVGAGFALYPFKSLGFLCSPIGKCVKLFLSVIAHVIFLLGGLMRDLAKWAVCQIFGDVKTRKVPKCFANTLEEEIPGLKFADNVVQLLPLGQDLLPTVEKQPPKSSCAHCRMRISMSIPLFAFLFGTTSSAQGFSYFEPFSTANLLPSFSIGNAPLPIVTDFCLFCITRYIKEAFDFQRLRNEFGRLVRPYKRRVGQCIQDTAKAVETAADKLSNKKLTTEEYEALAKKKGYLENIQIVRQRDVNTRYLETETIYGLAMDFLVREIELRLPSMSIFDVEARHEARTMLCQSFKIDADHWSAEDDAIFTAECKCRADVNKKWQKCASNCGQSQRVIGPAGNYEGKGWTTTLSLTELCEIRAARARKHDLTLGGGASSDDSGDSDSDSGDSGDSDVLGENLGKAQMMMKVT